MFAVRCCPFLRPLIRFSLLPGPAPDGSIRNRSSKVHAPLINEAINQTLSRTILTSCTTLLTVLVMYIFGGEGLRAFNFALLVGIIFGTYSSIAIASPLLMGFREAIGARAARAPVTV